MLPIWLSVVPFLFIVLEVRKQFRRVRQFDSVELRKQFTRVSFSVHARRQYARESISVDIHKQLTLATKSGRRLRWRW